MTDPDEPSEQELEDIINAELAALAPLDQQEHDEHDDDGRPHEDDLGSSPALERMDSWADYLHTLQSNDEDFQRRNEMEESSVLDGLLMDDGASLRRRYI
ncbi:hypothetical protein HKX48_006563 [Thoreauomyces humboldtii]|nr:hypothetical protein HKX48_006563 [Thoreauomyces humboldtii]